MFVGLIQLLFDEDERVLQERTEKEAHIQSE